MPNFRRFIKFMNEFIPTVMEDQREKERTMRWLEAELKKLAAKGELERENIEASSRAEILKSLYHPDYFKERNLPELAILNYEKQTNPELISGTQVPIDIEQQLGDANQALAQLVKYQMAGEVPPQEIIERVSKFFGEKTLTGAAGEIVKQREGAAERGIRGREVAVQEELTGVRKEELGARLKEIAGQVGDMTAKDARDTLFKLGQERRRYQAMLETKTDEGGDFIEPERLNQIRSNVTEIKQLEDKISGKFSEKIEREYELIAQDLKAKGYTAADLDTDEQVRSILIERGYNIQALKKYMR